MFVCVCIYTADTLAASCHYITCHSKGTFRLSIRLRQSVIWPQTQISAYWPPHWESSSAPLWQTCIPQQTAQKQLNMGADQEHDSSQVH